MPAFDGILQQASLDLQAIGHSLASVAQPANLPAELGDWLRSAARLQANIDDARGMLPVRETARVTLVGLPSRIEPAEPTKVSHLGHSVAFLHARLLGAQAYVGVCWAIYDNLSEVAVKLSCIDSVGSNPAITASLMEHFIKNQKYVPGRMSHILRESYGWPIGIAYAARNWLLHDGNAQDGNAFFADRDLSATPFALSSGALSSLENRCTDVYRIASHQTKRPNPWPWHDDDFCQMYQVCITEVDEAVGALVSWASSSARRQAELLLGAIA